MRRVSAKFVPRFLTVEQEESRLPVTTTLLQEAKTNQNFMEGIIAEDEAWVYGYGPETKCQTSQLKSSESPRPKKGVRCIPKS